MKDNLPNLRLVIGTSSGALYMFIAYLFASTGKLPDDHDINVYFTSTNWVYGAGTLYRDIPSEYPLLANVIFYFVRLLTFNADSTPNTFALIWIGLNSILFAGVTIAAIQANENKRNQFITLFTWLLPSTILFSLLRYDIYPATSSLLMMWYLRKESWIIAALWLGVTIALKGYAIFLIPVFFIYLYNKINIRFALSLAALSLTPFLGSLIIVIIFAGINALFLM